MNGEPLRLAFVIPWFGRELKGGAEQLCWQLATRLARRGHAVEVFTTCCRSFLDDWGTNQLPEGPEVLDGVTVHRYPVDARDRAAFDHLNAQLLALPRASLYPEIPPLDPAHSAIWTSDNINSRALEDALAERAPDLHAVVFIPYLYGTTLRAISLVGSKAWLQPCLHDECYAYLPEVATAMRDARGVLFNSDGEQALAARLYGPAMWAKGHAIGGAVEFDALERHRDAPLPPAVQGRRFVLFLGRRDMGKGDARVGRPLARGAR